LKVQLGTASRGEIEMVKTPNVSIYPNPVTSNFKIDMGGYTEPVSVVITDMYGRRIMNRNFTGTTSIGTGKFAAGVYMITITDKNGESLKQHKLVKE
jgi:hypothetical protein